MLYADGNLNSNPRLKRINLTLKDVEHVEAFAAMFDANVHAVKQGCFSCDVCNVYVFESLQRLGLIPKKSKLDISGIFDQIPDDLMSHFIRGIFDGDGWISKTLKLHQLGFCGNLFTMARINNEFGKQLIKPSKISQHRNGCFQIVFAGQRINQVSNYLYNNATIYLQRKFVKFGGVPSDI
jgi:hypothetical protein